MDYLVPGLKINKVTIFITEQTLREIITGLENFKKKNPEQTAVYAESKYDPIRYLISIETEPKTQESVGYKINGGQ